jgi:hypothetical protein
MIKHAEKCWGEEAWKAAEQCRDAAEVRSRVTGPIISSGTFNFKPKENIKPTYSNQELTKAQAKSVVIFNGSFES